MAHFKIMWNAGYGDNWAFVEANTKEEADQLAYEAWHEEAESAASYSSEGPLNDPTKDPDHPDYKDDDEAAS